MAENASSPTIVARTNVDFIYPADQDAQPDEKTWLKGGVLTVMSTQIRLTSGTTNHDFPLKGLEDVEERTIGARQVMYLTRYNNGKFLSCAMSASPKTLESLKRFFIQFISDSFKTGHILYFACQPRRRGRDKPALGAGPAPGHPEIDLVHDQGQADSHRAEQHHQD